MKRLSALLLFLSIAWVACPVTASAHQLDEYLQATLVEIGPKEVRLQMNLTPGVDLAEQVIAQVDPNDDGVVAPKEAAAYAELVKRDLTARLDQSVLELKLTNSSFPPRDDLRTGWGIIRLEFTATLSSLPRGTHVFTLQNRHRPSVSAYLFNASRPTAKGIHIVSQQRNVNQSTGEIEYTWEPPAYFPGRVEVIVLGAIFGVCAGRMMWMRRAKSVARSYADAHA